jgi:hypothetical protein
MNDHESVTTDNVLQKPIHTLDYAWFECEGLDLYFLDLLMQLNAVPTTCRQHPPATIDSSVTSACNCGSGSMRVADKLSLVQAAPDPPECLLQTSPNAASTSLTFLYQTIRIVTALITRATRITTSVNTGILSVPNVRMLNF